MSELRRYWSRFVLPVLLLAAAIIAWQVSSRLGAVEPAAFDDSSDSSVDTPLASVLRVPEFVESSSQADAVAAVLATLPADPGGLSCTQILVDGQAVLDVRSNRSLVPAYAQMLITGHAAIDQLGPEYRYETQVFADALPDLNGRIFDGIYLIGGGDPGLMSLPYSLSFRPARSTRTAVEDLAQAVAEAGVVRIDGGVIAVEGRYDSERSLPGWPDEYLSAGVIGPLSALQLDDGFAERAAANLGVAVPASDPSLLAADRFADQLTDLDVQVFGDNRALGVDESVAGLVPVARIFSPPLAEIVFQTLAVNDATAAEMLVKEMGVTPTAAGTTQAGGRAVQQTLRRQGVELDVPFRDGSGLDPFGGTSCGQLAAIADSIPAQHPTLDVLPAHNLPGVFDGRLTTVELQADLRLVGGAQADASGLVGRTVGDGPRITVASIVNRPGGPTNPDLAYQVALVELVDDLRAAISLEIVALGD